MVLNHNTLPSSSQKPSFSFAISTTHCLAMHHHHHLMIKTMIIISCKALIFLCHLHNPLLGNAPSSPSHQDHDHHLLQSPFKAPPAFAPGPSCSWGLRSFCKNLRISSKLPLWGRRKGIPKGLLAQPIQTLPFVNPTTEQTL